MKKLADYLKLIRISNLLFIAVIQMLMYYCIATVVLSSFSVSSNLLPVYLCVLLMFATVLIAAGGYVINDYFDIKIDRINNPKRVIVTQGISKAQAMLFYQILTGLGMILGFVVSWFVRSSTLAFVFLIVPGILWFYSASYKRQLIVGNLMVAFCAALVPLCVAIAQGDFLIKIYGDFIYETSVLSILYIWICGFAVFAFFLTWIREIIKDLQDVEGDREMECRTMPIKWGVKRTKLFIYILIIITLTLMCWTVFVKLNFQNSGSITERYFLFGIILPFFIVTYMLYKAQCPNEYKSAGNVMKFIMLTGTLYSLVIKFILSEHITAIL